MRCATPPPRPMRRTHTILALVAVPLLLAGCDATHTEAEYAQMSDEALAESLAGLDAKAVPANAGCRTASVWAAVNPEAVPTTLLGLRALPSSLQGPALTTLSPAEQVRVWQSRFGEAYSWLSPNQSDELRRIAQVVTPQWVEALGALSESERAVQVHEEIGTPEALHAAFGPVALGLFTTIREIDPSNSTALSRSDHSGKGDSIYQASFAGDCDCAANSDWCNLRGHNVECGSGANDCSSSDRGCGFLLLWSCDGGCVPTRDDPPVM